MLILGLGILIGVTFVSFLLFYLKFTVMPVEELLQLAAAIILFTWTTLLSYEIYKMLK